MFTALRGRRRAVASVSIITAVSTALTVAALTYQGFTTTDMTLNDGGVWVTNPSGLLVGHLNAPAQVLDGGLTTTTNRFDVEQAGNTVFVLDQSKWALTSVNPATVALGQTATLPPDAGVSLGASTVAITEPSNGKLWVVPASQAMQFSSAQPPTYRLGKGGVATVSPDGTVLAVAPAAGKLVTVPVASDGTPGAPTTSQLGPIEHGDDIQIAAVGDQGVVLDATTGRLYLPGSGKPLVIAGGTHAMLQQSGPASSAVALETATSLISQPLDGSTPRAVQAQAKGTPIRPVQLGGCSYAAWSGSASYVRTCTGGSHDQSLTIKGASSTAQFVFRVNRDVVVLNDLSSGSVWLVQNNMVKVDNWNDVKPPPDKNQDENQNNSLQDVLQQTDPLQSTVHHPPVAVDETFGVRAGRTTILPVLDYASDPDGNPLTVSVADPKTSLGPVTPIHGGQQLEIAVPASASGSASFGYTLSDGIGGTASATIHVSVHPMSQNSPPTQNRMGTVLVEQGATVSYNVLADWIDPDGDDIYLASATATSDDTVHFTPDGTVTFNAVGRNLGVKTVDVVVSDGRASARGTLQFDVRAAGTTKPIANPDLATATTGQTITVTPLAIDQSPSGAPLTLAKVNDVAGTTITPNLAQGTFDFVAPKAGTYRVPYIVSDGPNTANGIVRVDVTDPDPSARAPIAVPDTVMLRTGQDALADVLANDTDPLGGVLVLQSISIPQGVGVTVAVINHDLLRVTDTPGISTPVALTYTVSNGHASAQSQLVVMPVPPPATLQPPVTVPQKAVVRTGDIVTLPVLDHDFSPSGSPLTLDQKLVAPVPPASDGLLFVSQGSLRFQAGSTPKTVNATYQVSDAQGQTTAGYVSIQP